MQFKSGTIFTHEGIQWTIQEVYTSQGKVHSFNAMAFVGYYMFKCFNIIENEQRIAA